MDTYIICIGGSRTATHWPKKELTWPDMIERLRSPVRSGETYAEYLALPKAKQDNLKDIGGFVAGSFTGDRRKASLMEGRSMLTLDMDNLPPEGEDMVITKARMLLGAYAIYSTRKHRKTAPRLRVVVPFDRWVTPDEYEPIGRRVAAWLGIDYCDPTTFEASRLMYWPSCSADGEYVFEEGHGRPINVDNILTSYDDWRDSTKWPQVKGETAAVKRSVDRQEDPTSKEGIVGAFCRTYDIPAVIEKYLPNTYTPTTHPDRYTFTGGSTSGGAVLYDNGKFLYSHHATDPCSGVLVNAFDLVRMHMAEEKDLTEKASFKEMTDLAMKDPAVRELVLKERIGAAEAFADTPKEENPAEWVNTLTLDSKGAIAMTVDNVSIILENDPRLKDKLATDVIAGCGLATGSLPWDATEGRRRWSEADDAGLFRFLEVAYRMRPSRDKVDMACTLIGSRHKINVITDYLDALTWDGIPRVDRLLIDYLGAEDTAYTRAVMRKSLCAAVARAYEGGVKYDYMPILTGPQGIGKSTFLAELGGEWFSDSLTSFAGKEAAELIQGTWINEIGELTAFSKQETNDIKQFLSKRSDIYRAAYGRRTTDHPRHCVFFGTSNDDEYLKDNTGNRRFWPVNVGVNAPKKSVWDTLPKEVDLIWAEAKCLWDQGERLYLPPEVEAMARRAQEEHTQRTGKEGLVETYLSTPIPIDWSEWNLQRRQMYYQGALKLPEDTVYIERTRVCCAEIWAECYGLPITRMQRKDSLEISGIIARIPGWQRHNYVIKFGNLYGAQKGFIRR